MNKERRNAVLALSATLIVGILIGLLGPGFFHKYNRGGHGRGGRDRGLEHNRPERFVGVIYKVVKPDSAQAKQIKPIAAWASQKIKEVEKGSNDQLISIMDSVRSQLKPILTEEQLKRLDEFDARARGRWRGDHRKDDD